MNYLTLSRVYGQGILVRQVVLLVIVALLPTFSILGSQGSMLRSLDHLEHGLVPLESKSEEVLNQTSTSIVSLNRAHRGDRAALGSSRMSLERAGDAADELVQLQKNGTDPKLPNLLEDAKKALERYGDQIDSVEAGLAQTSAGAPHSAEGSPLEAGEATRTAMMRALDQGEEALAKVDLVRVHVGTLVERARVDTLTRSKEAYTTILSMVGIAALLYVLFSTLWLHRYLVPLMRGFGELGDLGSGGLDLSRRLVTKGPDEVRSIASAFNGLLDDIGSMVQRIRGSADLITRASRGIAGRSRDVASGAQGQVAAIENISSSVEQVAASVKNLSVTSQDLAGRVGAALTTVRDLGGLNDKILARAETMRAEVAGTLGAIGEMNRALKEIASHLDGLTGISEETTTSMQQMVATIRLVGEDTQATLVLVPEVLAEAEKGRQSVARTIQAMGAIQAASGHTSRVIHSLRERAVKVGKILDVIDEVTDQTNLLALNASILSAQAGALGRGFGVVADEMKSLSGRVAESSREISILIRAVQDEIASAVESIEMGSREVENGVLLSHQAGDALERITRSVGGAVERVEAIARASKEQIRSSRHVLDVSGQMAERIARIRAGVREQSGAEEHVLRAAMTINGATTEVSSSAREAVKGVRIIIEAAEGMHDLTQMVARATAEQRRAVDLVVGAAREIDEIAHRHLAGAEGLTTTSRELEEQAGGFSQMLESFRLA